LVQAQELRSFVEVMKEFNITHLRVGELEIKMDIYVAKAAAIKDKAERIGIEDKPLRSLRGLRRPGGAE
jgi:hypothetical protein